MLAINLPESISLCGGNLYQYFGCTTTPALDCRIAQVAFDGFVSSLLKICSP